MELIDDLLQGGSYALGESPVDKLRELVHPKERRTYTLHVNASAKDFPEIMYTLSHILDDYERHTLRNKYHGASVLIVRDTDTESEKTDD